MVESGEQVVDFEQYVRKNAIAVEGLIAKKSWQEALELALQEPPYTADAESKNIAARTVVKALTAFKEADIKAAVQALGDEENLLLMKYLYKAWGMGLPARANAQMLTWHTMLVDHCGEALVVRAMYTWKWP
eukprot:TRINITY_DN32846_c0_g1_i1.p1 TRINITY_DN32846_c0_g1~~TRINITY_DN32846_c0_g1_i1.p1  ORF type:complete len:132 (+),score=25.15 TRINITY_DN32846_c0_g1_i1:83-478(+)